LTESNPEKRRAAQIKYRMANRKKRSEATRLARLKQEVRKSGETDEVIIDKRAKELMQERRRKERIT